MDNHGDFRAGYGFLLDKLYKQHGPAAPPQHLFLRPVADDIKAVSFTRIYRFDIQLFIVVPLGKNSAYSVRNRSTFNGGPWTSSNTPSAVFATLPVRFSMVAIELWQDARLALGRVR